MVQLFSRCRRCWPWLALAVAFLPAVFMAVVVWRHAVDVGCWDMWENAPLLAKWHDGTLTWGDLYAAQIQHRIVVPRLLIIALHHLSGGDFRWENYFTFGVFVAAAVMIWRLLCRTLGPSGWTPALALLANVLIFSPMLYQNLLWGSGMWMTLPLPCLLAALLVLHQGWTFWVKIGAVVLLAEVATHSFAHGLCLWPVLVVYVALQPSLGPGRRRLLAAGMIAVFATVTIAFYFHNFINVAYHAYTLKPGDPALAGSMADDPRKVLTVFLGFLGSLYARNPFALHPPIETAPGIGLAVLVLFIALAAWLTLTRPGRSQWPQALPWLALAAYVTGVGLMIGLGRANTGEFRAVTPRYLVVSSYFWIATGALLFLVARAVAQHWPPPARGRARIAGAAALGAALVWQTPNWQMGLRLTDVWTRARWQAQAMVMFIEHFPGEQGVATQNVLDKSHAYALESVRTLRRLSLFKTPVMDEPDLKFFRIAQRTLPPERAAFESATTDAAGKLVIAGYARFGVGLPPDLIVFATPAKDGRHTVVGIGQPVSTPAWRGQVLDYEFANAEALSQNMWHRWRASLHQEDVPDGRTELELWALDAKTRQITRFAQTLTVKKDATGFHAASDFVRPEH